MSYCGSCGGQLAAEATSCPVCGAQQNAYAYPNVDPAQAAPQPPYGGYVPPAGYPPQPPSAYPPAPYGAYPPQPYYYYPQSRGTNGMAIASLVVGALWLYWLGSVLALIFGYVARSQIKKSGQDGNGLAIAGIVLGWIGIVVLIVVIILVYSIDSSCSNYYGC